MTAKKKLLVTGAGGFLGWNVCNNARNHYDVHGTFRKHRPVPENVTMHSIDLCDQAACAALFTQVQPDMVIHTAAAADPNFCQNNPEDSWKINVDASAEIAALCSHLNIPFVFTSSDLVFDGKNAPYREDDPICPVSLYGEQKAAAEAKIRAVCDHATICRMPLMYGDAPDHAKSFIHPMISAIVAHTVLQLFTDEFRSPCCAADAAAGLILAAERRCKGILNLGGPERLSRYDMGILLGKALGITPDIIPTQQSEVRMSAPRPPDVSMVIDKAHTLGFAPKPMAERLSELRIIRKFCH